MGGHCRGQEQASDALLKEAFAGSPAPRLTLECSTWEAGPRGPTPDHLEGGDPGHRLIPQRVVSPGRAGTEEGPRWSSPMAAARQAST